MLPIFPLHWDNLLHYFIQALLITISFPGLLGYLFKRCYKLFGWVCWSCCPEFHFFFCASVTSSFQYAREFSTCDNAYLKWIAVLKISADAFLLIRIKYNCGISNVFHVHTFILLAQLHLGNIPFPPQGSSMKRLKKCMYAMARAWDGGTKALCVFTCFVRGCFLPSYKLLAFAGLVYQINN